MLMDTPYLQADAERRKAERRPMLTYVQLSQHRRVFGKAKTIDLSQSGFAGASDVILQVHQEIGLGINGIGTVYGEVVWVSGHKFAVHFEKPIELGLADVSSIMQPEVALPDWCPENSSSSGHFGKLGAEQYTSPEPVRLVSDKPQEEKPRDPRNMMDVEQNGWQDPVGIVSDTSQEEKPRDPRNMMGVEQNGWQDTVRIVDEKPRGEKPRDSRSRISAQIEIRKSGLKKCKADVLDISLTGFQLDCAVRLNEGERFFVDLPGIQTLSATVIWHADLRSGCKFETPISEYIYNDLLGRLSN